MGIIQYFRRLKSRFLARRQFQIQRRERFYDRCKEGIFSFFKPYLTRSGFYLDLEDKSGLVDYLSNKGRTIESVALKETPEPKIRERLWKKTEEYIKPVQDVFKRMVNYFKEFPKEQLARYSSLSFNYDPSRKGYETFAYGDKLSFNFG